MGESERRDPRSCALCGRPIYYGQFCSNDCATVADSLTSPVWEPPSWWPRCEWCRRLKVINGSWTAQCLECDALRLQPAWDVIADDLKVRIEVLCRAPGPRRPRRGAG